MAAQQVPLDLLEQLGLADLAAAQVLLEPRVPQDQQVLLDLQVIRAQLDQQELVALKVQ
jgi:hypothetical protein